MPYQQHLFLGALRLSRTASHFMVSQNTSFVLLHLGFYYYLLFKLKWQAVFKGNFQLQQISVTSCVSKGATERLSCASQGRLQQGHCLPHYLFHIFTSFSIYFNRLILERMLKWEEAQTKIFLCKLLPELLLLSLCWTIQTFRNNQN